MQTGLNFRGLKLSWMAADPQKPQKFNSVKVKAHMVLGYFFRMGEDSLLEWLYCICQCTCLVVILFMGRFKFLAFERFVCT